MARSWVCLGLALLLWACSDDTSDAGAAAASGSAGRASCDAAASGNCGFAGADAATSSGGTAGAGGAGGASGEGGAAVAPDFFCTFASSATDCGFYEQAKVPGRATLVDVARDGETALRLHTEPGDDDVAGSGSNERNDLTLGTSSSYCNEGQVEWWAHSVLFPSDYVDPPESTASTWNWCVVFDFHNSAAGAGQANFQINAWPTTAIASDRPTGLGFQIAYGNPADPSVFRTPIGPLQRDVWLDFVYHVKWSSNGDGFFDAWLNGKKQMSYSGPTLYAGQACYLKLANYHTAFGQPSSVIHDRVARGATPESVSLTPLEGIN